MQGTLRDLEQALQQEDLWSNPQKAADLLRRQEQARQEVEKVAHLQTALQEYSALWTLATQENETDLQAEMAQQIKILWKDANRRRVECFFSKPEDSCACFLSIQAGSGGTEAQDWAAMLLRMYLRWAERKKYQVSYLDDTPGEEAGIKSATLKIMGKTGSFPYGWLKGEVGVHRLVRISPFDANARRHTSFASISLVPELPESAAVEIQEKDIRMDTYRASGAGGQHVNKTDSAVRITHIPSGIVVQCQVDRSQHRNRAIAMEMLQAKLHTEKLRQRQESLDAVSHQDKQGISWGHQIRSYVLQPYQLVKDVRTGFESSNPLAILDGDLDDFLNSFLVQEAGL